MTVLKRSNFIIRIRFLKGFDLLEYLHIAKTTTMDAGGQLLCLNILAYKKPGITTDQYRNYMVNVHAPLVSGLMEKYGFLQWSMTHTTSESAEQMRQLYDAQFANIAPYDCCISIVFPDIDCFIRMKADPYFKQTVGPDHENFADTKKSQMMIGWCTPILKDGKTILGMPNHVVGEVH